jgi:8-oxo-dGTP pyrophosphatase MutT (NUDIX family)
MKQDPFIKNLQRLLTNRRVSTKAEWDATPAAVLVPLYYADSDWHLLFTRRTDAVESHRGQVSFPGGMIEDQDDSPEEAALREMEEEIGVRPEDVEIIGRLDTLLTVTQFRITPVVGQIPWPYDFHINPTEVAKIFGVPLPWLSDARNLEINERMPLAPGPKIAVYFYRPFAEEVIWGATARMTMNLLEILGMKPEL